jgi:N-acetylglucosaminyldiphosphoundecaprenol N-acetyl-beta-D-mannosaminyltransferase
MSGTERNGTAAPVTYEVILGVRVASFTYDTLLAEADRVITSGRQAMVVAINPEKLVKAQSDPALKKLLNEVEMPIADGIGVVLASRWRGGAIRERVTGIESMLQLCRHAAAKGYPVFLLGAKPGVAEKAARLLQSRYPGLQIAGTQHGYFEDDREVVEQINRSGAQILFVAMGSPRQEYWIRQHMGDLAPRLFQGVGGSLDVICGNIPRAPEWAQRAGLEWLYRLLKEPSRWRRQLALPRFLWMVLTRKG